MLDALRAIASSSKGYFDILGSKIYGDVVVPDADLTGKRALVTGATSGIGKEIALQLAKWGAEVVLLARDKTKAQAARNDIIKQSGNDQVSIEAIDLASLTNTKDFVRRWNQRPAADRRIDLLISNAGVAVSKKTYTADNFEISYHVNALSHYALIVPLIQLGCMAPDARIITVASSGIYASKKLDPDDMNSDDILSEYKLGETTNFEKLWSLSARSKAAQVVFVRELATRLEQSQRWKGITIQSCHPGAVKTEIWARPDGVSYNPVMASWAQSMIEAIGISPQQGATTPLWLATAPEATNPESKGKYWERCGWKWTPAWMEDAELRTALWKRFEEDTKIQGAIL